VVLMDHQRRGEKVRIPCGRAKGDRRLSRWDAKLLAKIDRKLLGQGVLYSERSICADVGPERRSRQARLRGILKRGMAI